MRVRTAQIIDPRCDLLASLASELDARGIAVVDSSGYGVHALEIAFGQRPDLILIRVAAPAARPLQLIHQIRDALPNAVIVGLVEEGRDTVGSAVISSGASACFGEPRDATEWRGLLDAATAFFERRGRDLGVVAAQGGRVIAVLGAKGGVGKTTIATNLAVSLALETNSAVALVDADPLFGDVALALDLEISHSITEVAALLDDLQAGEIRPLMTAKYGVWTLGARSRARRGPITADHLARLLEMLRREFDYVVVDTAGAFSDLTIAAIDQATTRILVTTAELNTVRDAGRFLRLLRTHLGQGADLVQVIHNRFGMAGSLDAAAMTSELGAPPSWFVEDEPRFVRAMADGLPAVERYPRRRASIEIRSLAASLAAGTGPIPRPPVGRQHGRTMARLLALRS